MVIYNYYLMVCLLANILQDHVLFGEVTCKSNGPCSCVLSNGKGAVDFGPTKGLGSAPLYSASTVGADTAKFDPCREFQCGSDTSRVCLIDGAISPSIETGVGNDISYQYDEFGGLVTFVYTQGKYTTYIEVHCESGLSGAGILSKFTQNGKTFFYATLKSKYACLTEDKRKKKLSAGTVLCILLLVIIFLYVVIGVVVNKYIRKLEGEEVFPNIKFWKDFPSLVKDGFMFTKSFFTNMLLLLIFIFISVFKVTTVYGVKCTPVGVGACACELSDGSGTIDLSPLKKFGDAPLYKNILDTTNPGIKYDFDPCRQFACGTSGNTKVCSYVVSRALKIGNDISFEYDEKAKIVSFVYSQVDQQINFKTSVQMHCEQAKTGKGEITDFTEGKQASNFYANLDSTYACLVPSTHDHPGKLSTGTVLCIMLLVIIFLYIFIGVIVNKYIRKLEGEEVFSKYKVLEGFSISCKEVWLGPVQHKIPVLHYIFQGNKHINTVVTTHF